MKIRSVFAALAALSALAVPAAAGPYLVVDAATGQVLKAEEATRPWHPASTTKMMTLYLALKAVREGRLSFDTPIPASPLAAKQPRVKVYIRAGQEITLDNAIKIMMVKSANDIAYVVAEGVGGTVENFVAMMNAEAQRLGMAETHFVNPNGWHHAEQQVSARDLATLAIALMRDFPESAHYWDIGAVQLGKTVIKNTNGLVGRYPGVNGFKTGFVCASGFNVVASATRGGRTLIAVVLGALSGAERTVLASQLLDEGFASWGGGASLASLPSSGYGTASSICDQVRRRGGGGALADDVDVEGPLTAQTNFYNSSDNGVADRFPTVVQPAARGAGAKTSSGRYVLGARAEFVPEPVAFGRTEASARAPAAANVLLKNGTQFAAASPQGGAVEGAPARARTVSTNGAIPGAAAAFASTDGAGGKIPMQLQGSVLGGVTPRALRPGMAAVPAKPETAKPQTVATAPANTPAARLAAKAAASKATASKLPGAKTRVATTQPGKTGAAKPQASRLQPVKPPPGRIAVKPAPPPANEE